MRVSSPKSGPRAGDEVLEARADGEDDVGIGGERVGRGRADDADRPDIHRVVVDEHGAAVDGLGDRDVVLLGEGGERLAGERIVDAAAGDDQRLLRLAEQLRRLADLVGVGPRARDAMDRLLEERDRIVVGLGLDVLGEAR